MLSSYVQEKLYLVVDLDDLEVWERAMPMAMENLFIIQHCAMFRYSYIHSNNFQPQL